MGDQQAEGRKRRRNGGSRVLGDRIRRFRNRLKLSQEHVAHRIGRSEQWLLLVENGRADPTYSDLLKLAEVLEVKVEQLLTDEVEEQHQSPHQQSVTIHPPLLDADRIASVWQRPPTVDTPYLDELETLISWYWQRYHTTAPTILIAPVSAHVAQLWPLLDRSFPESIDRRLRSLIAQGASLAGWLTLRLTNRSATAMYWSLAETLATDAEDGFLGKFALASRSSLYTSTLYGGRGGDTTLALAFLDASAGTSSLPPIQMAWTLARRAEEHAARGDGEAAQRDLDASAAHLARAQGRSTGYFAAWDTAQLSGYRGSCAQVLGSPEAVTILAESLAATDPVLISQRTAILTNLGAAHARLGQVEEACTALAEALTVAGRTNLAVAIQRVRGVRGSLDPWGDAPSVRHLDELLADLT